MPIFFLDVLKLISTLFNLFVFFFQFVVLDEKILKTHLIRMGAIVFQPPLQIEFLSYLLTFSRSPFLLSFALYASMLIIYQGWIVWQLDLQLPMQSVPITTNIVSLNPVHGNTHSIHYVIKFVSDIVTGRWFSPGTLVFSTNKTDSHDITEILMKVAP